MNKFNKRLKKSDRLKQERSRANKIKKIIEGKELLEGRILSISLDTIQVASTLDFTQIFCCTLRGSLKKEKEEKNLIVVGDRVLFEQISVDRGVIYLVQQRSTWLQREDPQKKKVKLIAANIDQTLITTSAMEPPLVPEWIDRYIIASWKGHLQPCVIINKMDLVRKNSKEAHLIDQLAQIYASLGVPLILISTKSGQGLLELQALMQGKTSVFTGQSGVGKSTLINAIAHTSLRVQEVSLKTKRGVHTTSRSELIYLSCGGFCIDTPGIQLFGLGNITLEDLRTYFVEIARAALRCQYLDCTHTHEPNCAVRDAVQREEIHPLRFASYIALFKEILKSRFCNWL